MPTVSAAQWDEFVARHPQAHLLQTRPWAELKAAFGWSVAWIIAGDCGAQVLFRRLPLGFSIAYLPKGPLGENWRALLPELDAVCRAKRAIWLTVEVDAWEPLEAEQAAVFAGWQAAAPIQPQRTVLIDLSGTEADWLERMKPKTRYNIRLAERKGVSVRPVTDVDGFYNLMQITGERDNFGVHSLEYYRRAYQLFATKGACALLQAEFEGQPLAALMVFAHGERAWYFYGASGNAERSRMPTYLLQWEAMRWAAARGCTTYDLWGIPDVDENALEEEFTARQDGLWGVYRFKRGFGGQVLRSAGAYKRVYQPLLHRIIQMWLLRRGGEAG